MIFKPMYLILVLCVTMFSFNDMFSQDKMRVDKNVEKDTISENMRLWNTLVFFDYRGIHTIEGALGSSKTTGDIPDSENTFYYKLGYKYFIKDHYNVNLSFHSYKVKFGDSYNEQFMSIDLNFEYFASPYGKFSPFIQAGFGYNANTNSNNTSFKFQWALGVEYIVVEGVGLKIFGEHITNFTDELDGLIEGETNDLGIRLGGGINIYFGGKKRKAERLSRIKTVINSNLLE